MARPSWLPKSINYKNTTPDPFVVDNLTVNNNATIGNDLIVNKNVTLNTGNLTITTGNLVSGGNATIGADLNVTEDIIAGGLIRGLDLEITNDIDVIKNLNVGGNLDVVGVTSLHNNLTVDGKIDLTNTLTGTAIVSNTTLSANDFSALGTTLITNFGETSSGIRTVTQANTSISNTDKILQLVTTGAGGPFVIDPTNLGPNIYRLIIIMTGFNTGSYTFQCLQGTVTFNAIGHVASFIWTGSVWSLTSNPYGAIVDP